MNCRCISDIFCMHILFLHSYSEEYHLLIRTLSAILVAELKNLNMQLESIFQNLVTICIIEKVYSNVCVEDIDVKAMPLYVYVSMIFESV